MCKIACLCLIIVLFAAGTSFADTPLKKLGRGFANIISCPIEIPYRIGEANVANGPFAAATWGLFDGIYRTLVRATVGVY
ncbi:MAG: exosortase system-associated protein, TIGR04073 family, partial [Candidatus Omnitrophota bacterium]